MTGNHVQLIGYVAKTWRKAGPAMAIKELPFAWQLITVPKVKTAKNYIIRYGMTS